MSGDVGLANSRLFVLADPPKGQCEFVTPVLSSYFDYNSPLPA